MKRRVLFKTAGVGTTALMLGTTTANAKDSGTQTLAEYTANNGYEITNRNTDATYLTLEAIEKIPDRPR